MLLIIPGIIFGVFWIFAVYIFFSEKGTIRSSLKKSRKIVNGKWWRIFGSILLLVIIVSFISGIIGFPAQLAMAIFTFAGGLLPTWTILFSGVMQVISGIVSMLIGVFMILFFKNFYFDLKGKRK